MPGTINETADALIGREIECLDHGFVRLIDYMGGDQRIVQAARVSYGEGTKKVSDDKNLIGYLMKHRHTSPFEQVNLTIHAKMPIFVARQWVRHRTAKLNEISGRYSIMKDEFYVPSPEHICFQSTDNKQGRSGPIDPANAELVRKSMAVDQDELYSQYREYADPGTGFGIAKETARNNLPLSLYTEWYWTIDLHNLFHFLGLRMDSHAQYEIRVYADALAEIAKAIAPLAYEAFEEHQFYAETFSRKEMLLLRDMLTAGIALPAPEEVEDRLGKRNAADFIRKVQGV